MTAPTSQPDFPSEPQSSHQSQNGRFRIPVAEHRQWRDHLDSRHILEPVIAAGAWVERDAKIRQDALVLLEKGRDGSPGVTRRRLPPSVSSKGAASPLIQLLRERVETALDEAMAAVPAGAVKTSGAVIRTNIVREIGDARNDSTSP